MKLNTQLNEVTASDGVVSSQFKIQTSQHAFKILSSGIYSDKIRAIVRELSCNAWDAHCLARNKNKRFVIQVPNALEPIFRIRDFGPGLSVEEAEDLYTTYFASTKSNTNEFTGAFGLGSKSPFSYTDSFLVNSYYGGRMYMYSIFLNEAGVPSISLLSETETDEESGLEVIISVEREDFEKFNACVRSELKWFPLSPEIVGTHSQPYTDFKIPSTGFITVQQNSYQPTLSVVQGNVEYPVRIDKLDFPCHLPTNSVAFFEIGELEVAVSREEIAYTEDNIAKIKKRVNQIIRAERKLISKRLSQFDCYADAAHYMTTKKVSRQFRNHVGMDNFKWRGKRITTTVYIDAVFDVFSPWKKGARRETLYINYESIDSYVFVVIDDLKKSPRQRVMYNRTIDYNMERKTVVLVPEHLKNSLFSKVGVKEYILLSSLSEVPKKDKVSKTKKKLKVQEWYRGQWGAHDVWEDVEKTPDSGFYVELTRNSPDLGIFRNIDIQTLVTFARGWGIMNKRQPLYGIRRGMMKHVDHTAYKNLVDVIIEKLPVACSTESYKRYLRVDSMMYDIKTFIGRINDLDGSRIFRDKLGESHPLCRVITEKAIATTNMQFNLSVSILSNYMGIDTYFEPIAFDLSRYPLIQRGFGSDGILDAVEYIQIKDKKFEEEANKTNTDSI